MSQNPSALLGQNSLAAYNRTGSWPKSIAVYHSDTPLFADEYQRRVLAMWQEHKATHLSGLIHVERGLIYGAFGSTGRVYGLILPGDE
jgi:hypothetical protein